MSLKHAEAKPTIPATMGPFTRFLSLELGASFVYYPKTRDHLLLLTDVHRTGWQHWITYLMPDLRQLLPQDPYQSQKMESRRV